MRKPVLIIYLLGVHALLGVLVLKTDFISRVEARLGINPPPQSSSPWSVYDVDFRKRMNGLYDTMDSGIPDGSTIFIGDSITQGLCVNAVTASAVNFGIGCDTTAGVLERMPKYRSMERASALVLAIGVNDLRGDGNDEDAVSRYGRILESIPTNTPVIVSAVLPVVDASRPAKLCQTNERIYRFNERIKALCATRSHCLFLDASAAMRDKNLHTSDGLHLNGDGYAMWIKELRKAHASVPRNGGN